MSVLMIRPPPRSGLLELEVLVRRHVEAGDGMGEDVLHTRPEARGKAEVIDRGLGGLLIEDALHLEKKDLALLPVELLGLAAEEVVDLGQGPEGESPVLRDEGLEARGG